MGVGGAKTQEPPQATHTPATPLHNVIDYDYIESDHDYNRDYICLETSSERKQTPFAWFDVYFQTTYDMNECNKRNY